MRKFATSRQSDRGGADERRALGWGLAVVAAFNALFVLWLRAHPNPHGAHRLVGDMAGFVGPFLALPWCFRGGAKGAGRSPGRAPALLGLGILGYGLGEVLWTVYECVLRVDVPTPAWTDAAFLGAYPLLLAGLLRVPTRPMSPSARARVVLDGLITTMALFTFSWYFLLGPILQDADTPLLGKISTAAYPAFDLILAWCALGLLSRSVAAPLRPGIVLLAVGFAFVVLTDTVFAYQVLKDAYHSGGLLDAGWSLGYMLVGLGAGAVRRAHARLAETAEAEEEAPERPVHWLPNYVVPSVLVIGVYALLLTTRLTPYDDAREPGVIVGSAALVGLLMLRQFLALAENGRLLLSLTRALAAQAGVAARLQAQAQAVTAAEARTRLILETALDAVIAMNAAGVITDWNAQAEAVFGWSHAEAVGRRLSDAIIPPEMRDAHERSLSHFLATGEGRILGKRVEMEAMHQDGRRFPVELSVSCMRAGASVAFSAFARDISDQRQAEQTIRWQAHHDALTGLPNRALFQDRLEQVLARAGRAGEAAAVLFLDLDGFKHINDTLGHEAGDALLQEVARRLIGALRREDTVARMGGDEFTVILPSVRDAEDAIAAGRQALAAFDAPFTVRGREFVVTGSMGISLFPFDGRDGQTLLQHADVAMYRAKELGRNGWQLFNESMNEVVSERLALEVSLRRAIEGGELALHYQPQQCLASGRILGVEALVRWRHPEFGLVPPERFIPLAEQTGLILPLGDWVLREACRQAAAWQAAGLPLRVSVNLAARQVRDGDLAARVPAILAQSGLSPQWLDLELTETALIEDGVKAIDTLTHLRALGIRLSVDDFGTGYSSLSYLRHFPLDALKVDRSFMNDLVENEANQAVVRAIIELAQGLNLGVVAEGVETTAQRDWLAACDCDILQGYLLSPPLPAPDLERLVRAFAAPAAPLLARAA